MVDALSAVLYHTSLLPSVLKCTFLALALVMTPLSHTAVGLDDDHMIAVWDWPKGTCLATARGHKDKIFVIKWNPFKDNEVQDLAIIQIIYDHALLKPN